MAAAGGSQCGYCTPGFVMSLFAEQYRPDRQGPCDPLSMAGNLCRCTGYRPIRDAALALGPAPPGPLRDRLDRPAPALDRCRMRRLLPSVHDRRVRGACSRGDPEATLVGGVHRPRRRIEPAPSPLAAPRQRRSDRRAARVRGHAVHASRSARPCRLATSSGAGAARRRSWREWLALFASPPIRNRATLGGNLATASPIGDAAPLLLALDASVHVGRADGPPDACRCRRSSRGIGRRRCGAGEMLTAVEIPQPLPELVRFYKVAKRRLDDISTVAAAMAIDRDATGRVRRAPLCVRRRRGDAGARRAKPSTPWSVSAWNEAAVERVQRVLDRVADADERPSGIGGVPAARSRRASSRSSGGRAAS